MSCFMIIKNRLDDLYIVIYDDWELRKPLVTLDYVDFKELLESEELLNRLKRDGYEIRKIRS